MTDLCKDFTAAPSNTVLRAMFAARKRVFVDLLGWDVPVLEDAYEIDQFDTPDAAYVVLADDAGNHQASARLLCTEGPHILRDLFPCLSDGPIPAGAGVREITRFCLEPTLERLERRAVRDRLVSALVDHALTQDIETYTAVATRSWFRQIADFGWQCRPMGSYHKVGRDTLIALRIDIDRDTPAALASNGIYRRSPFMAAGATRELVS